MASDPEDEYCLCYSCMGVLCSDFDQDYVKDAILEGRVPFDKAHGMVAVVCPGTDPRFKKVFNEGMRCRPTS